METLHTLAGNMPLTYITATLDTVTPPESLITLFDEYFQYFARKGHIEPSDAEQVRPILDLINYDYSLLSGDSGLQGANNDLHLLGSIAGLPPVATLAARYRFTQEVYSNNPQKDEVPAMLAGEMLAREAVADALEVTERYLAERLDVNEGGGILSVETPGGAHYPAKQFNADGSVNRCVGSLIRWLPRRLVEEQEWVKLFIPHVTLGYVSPVEYAKISDDHREALAFAYSRCEEWADDAAHMEVYMSGDFENSPYWDGYANRLEGWVIEDGLG
jgi:hypothetical protein